MSRVPGPSSQTSALTWLRSEEEQLVLPCVSEHATVGAGQKLECLLTC
jgi:hypothetical protein